MHLCKLLAFQILRTVRRCDHINMKYLALCVLPFLFLLTNCVSTQKYNLLVQSAQKNNIEKQQLADSINYFKNLLTKTISKKDSSIALKNKTLDSLQDKYILLRTSYIDLEKNVFEKNQEFQQNAKSYLSQIAQRDSLLRQIITQSKELMYENQRLTSNIENLKKGVLSAAPQTTQDTASLVLVDSLYLKINNQIKNFIGQEMGIQKQKNKIQILLAHQLLFQEDKLSEDGDFVLSMIAKILKNEKKATIALLNYATQEVAEKDNWERSVTQFLNVTKALNEAGVDKQQITQLNVASTEGSKTEVGVAIQRLEIWIGF